MLLSFLYHKIGKGKYCNSKKMIEDHFIYLKKKYIVILPGDKISPFKLNICLTFDDAYFDFYHYVFPLLKKYNLKAVLAVPIKYISESTDIEDTLRLDLPYDEITDEKNVKEKVPFCTWEEIKEMSNSGLVHIANHSYSHINLLKKEVNLHLEIIESKKILERKLNREISTFIYPFGKFNKEIHKLTKDNYKYIMRIGSAINLCWHNFNKITYRISSDNLLQVNSKLKPLNFFSYIIFYLLNSIRGR